MADPLRTTDYSRKPWLALAVFTLGLVTTLVAWHLLRNHEWMQARWTTQLAADAIRNDLTESIQYQLYGLDRLALLWESADPPQPLWTDNARLYIQHRPGCIAVEWLAPDGDRRAVVAAERQTSPQLALDGVPRSLIENATDAKSAAISTPMSSTDGTKQYAIAYPVYSRDKLRGFVISFFDFERSLNYILEDVRPLGYSIDLSQGDQHEYLLAGDRRERERAWETTAEVPVPGGLWTIHVWPGPDVLDRVRSRIPETTLLVGSLLSFLLALVVHLGTAATRNSARIRQINEQLILEIRSRTDAQRQLSRAHGELERAHGELELRVQQRTGDLAAANKLLEHEINEHQKAEQSLQELTGRLFHLQDEERRRLARELHDGATQNLIALATNIAKLQKGSPSGDHYEEVMNDSALLIQQSIRELRTTSHLLHPPLIEELGLPAPLRSYVNGFVARSGIEVALTLDPILNRLEHDAELAIFRVVQESLTNIHRHSRSRTASILLARQSDDIRLEISDEGVGIPPEVLSKVERGMAGVGIAGIRERVRLLGGRLEIISGGVGTTVRVLLPFTEAKPSEQLAISA